MTKASASRVASRNMEAGLLQPPPKMTDDVFSGASRFRVASRYVAASRSLRTAGAKGPSDLPEGWLVLAYTTGGKRVYLLKDADREEVARVHAERRQGCGKVWVITSARAWQPGWGPMLYDVAMEDAGSDGVMPDRDQVSSDARRVWDYYFTRRPDVQTTDVDWGCERHGDPDDWDPHPLDQVYRKEQRTVIPTLAAQGAWRGR